MSDTQTKRVSIPQDELTKEQEIQILRDLQNNLPASSYLRGLFNDGLIEWVQGQIQSDLWTNIHSELAQAYLTAQTATRERDKLDAEYARYKSVTRQTKAEQLEAIKMVLDELHVVIANKGMNHAGYVNTLVKTARATQQTISALEHETKVRREIEIELRKEIQELNDQLAEQELELDDLRGDSLDNQIDQIEALLDALQTAKQTRRMKGKSNDNAAS